MGARKKVPVVNVTTGERFSCAGDAAKNIGVDRTAIVYHLRHNSSRPVKGCNFEYERLLVQKEEKES